MLPHGVETLATASLLLWHKPWLQITTSSTGQRQLSQSLMAAVVDNGMK